VRIVYSDSFASRFDAQVAFIAMDKYTAALKFEEDILKAINSIPERPLKHRKSIWSDDPNTRDLIFKGYTIIYKIDWDKEEILVFGFLKDQETPDFGSFEV
jgi:mRNA-degrading endonuclease RelE of RelBE toxin-antitoxin system